MSFFVYILLCMDGSFYTGYTKDLQERTNSMKTAKAQNTPKHTDQKK